VTRMANGLVTCRHRRKFSAALCWTLESKESCTIQYWRTISVLPSILKISKTLLPTLN